MLLTTGILQHNLTTPFAIGTNTVVSSMLGPCATIIDDGVTIQYYHNLKEDSFKGVCTYCKWSS